MKIIIYALLAMNITQLICILALDLYQILTYSFDTILIINLKYCQLIDEIIVIKLEKIEENKLEETVTFDIIDINTEERYLNEVTNKSSE